MNAEELKPKAIKASERFLESRGYEILETSWECTAGGADIIARDDADVVFVEVNAKTNTEAGFPAERAPKRSAPSSSAPRSPTWPATRKPTCPSASTSSRW